jgi:hypothetical protein
MRQQRAGAFAQGRNKMATLLAAEVTVFRDIVQAIQMGLAHSFSPDQRCIIFHNDAEGQNQPQLNHSATGRSPSRTFRAEMKLARRTLGKGLAAGSVLAGLSHLVGGESQPILTLPDTVTWKEIDRACGGLPLANVGVLLF